MNEYPYLKLYFLIIFPDWAVKWNMSATNPHENRAYFLNYTPFVNWPRILAWGGFDIALNPVAHNEFNRCKSNCKYLDFAMAGIPGVYERFATYDCVMDGDTALTAATEDEWYQAIRRLIEDEPLRRHMREQARSHVLNAYNIDNHIHLWQSAYERFAALEPNVECLLQSASPHLAAASNPSATVAS